MKKSNEIILGVIIVLLIVAIGVGGYILVKNNKTTNEEKENLVSNLSNSVTVENNKNVSEEEVLYMYSSGDNAAVNGNPEVLYVYEMNNDVIKFKYHTSWNEEDIKGVANKTSSNLFMYVNGNIKIELLLNAVGENSIKVTEYKNDSVSSWKNLWREQDSTENRSQNSNSNVDSNVNGTYTNEAETNNYYHKSDIIVSNQTDTTIKFTINAVHGNDIDHVNTGEVSGIANKVNVPADSVVPESEQIAYQYTEVIDGKTNKITLIYTAHRTFQYIDVKEEYADNINPYAGNAVYFSGEYEKVK